MKEIISLIVFLNTFLILGQTPSNDPHWQLVWQDDFNFLNTNIWKVEDNFDHYGEPQMYRSNNVSISNGNLIITVKNESYLGHSYTSGWIESKQNYNTQYGFIESRIKLPNGHGFWPAFWTFVGSGVVNGSNAAEIDIFEMLGSSTQAPNIVGTNIHKEYCDQSYPDYPVCSSIPNYGLDLIPTNFNYTDWHTYGLEWSPSKLVWYIDGFPVRLLTNHGVSDPVRIILNLAIEPWALPNGTTPFPSNMFVDFVKVYNLNNDCNTNLDVCNYNFSNHTNKVNKNITIGNGSCYNSLISGDNIFLRASKGVIINGDFSVPLGAQLYIDVNTCY